jgi:8-oxo-dGTP diphosphatase
MRIMSEPAHFRFCPVCGGPFGTKQLRPHEPPRLVCGACGFIYYIDPKVAVGTIIGLDGGVLLARRAIEPGYGQWVFPGGYVDRGEVVEDAARREAREEVGLEVRLDRLVGIYSYPGTTPIVVVYAATPIGGTLALDDESLEARRFGEADVPWTELAFRSTAQALRDYFQR